ncbi:hypothetical protein LTR66_009633 [Elasticomyces elasticus]|nr:hypothetical protein LTR66_009633 [Elasticomyces elasticus]
MGKRASDAVAGAEVQETKRRKTTDLAPPKEDIHNARQLQQLLAFQQNDISRIRFGVQSFKAFLESILYPDDNAVVPHQRAILCAFLDSQNPKDVREYNCLPDLLQAWSFASQTNNENFMSAVSAIFALLLKTVSGILELKEHGYALCKTMLQHAQLKLVARSLAAPKHKEHLISPCLRLVTEIVSFDGGALAKQVYAKRDFTCESKVLARNLSVLKASENDDERPSVRSNALKFLLANLRLQNEGAKMDILKQGHVIRALFDNIRHDSVETVKETLTMLRTYVLESELPRSSKSSLLTGRSLSSVASLLRASDADDIVPLEFLIAAATRPEYGILARPGSWYPPGINREGHDEDDEGLEAEASLNLGLASIDRFDRFNGHVPVRNTTLSGFLQSLKPHSNLAERQVVLAAFTAAPELVADYFFRKSNFSFDPPKLSNTWIGYASFLFSVVDLPVSENGVVGYFPPPVSIVTENILPRALTQAILARCLNQQSGLITFFAVRIMIRALQKLRQVLQIFENALEDPLRPGLWEEAAQTLLSSVCLRCPTMKDIVLAFRRVSSDAPIQKEAIAHLVSLYYAVLPQLSAEEKFDVSNTLTSVMTRLESSSGAPERPEERGMCLSELQHLLAIAQRSPGMRWWHKQGSLKFSPCVSLLRLYTKTPNSSAGQIESLLRSIIDENGILSPNPECFMALTWSLRLETGLESSDAVFGFLDECLGRLVRKPLKYLDDLEALVAGLDRKASRPVSLLLAVLYEQIPFIKQQSTSDQQKITSWLASLLSVFAAVGEDKVIIRIVSSRLKDTTGQQKLSNETFKNVLSSYKATQQAEHRLTNGSHEPTTQQIRTPEDAIVWFDVPAEEKKNAALTRWEKKEVEEVVEDGDAAKLVLCLSSADSNVRMQAVVALWRFAAKVLASSYAERDQVYLLLTELIETCSERPDDTPLPYTASTFAAQALRILTDPTHVLYPKINRFLLRAPSWHVTKLPAYWIDKIILSPPDEDDGYWEEVAWLLTWLVDALRTSADMEIFRTRNVFECVLALYSSPSVTKPVQEAVLQLVYRATCAGGSTTLITRSGMLGWLEARVKMRDRRVRGVEELMRRLWETCDQKRVREWSHGSITGVGL